MENCIGGHPPPLPYCYPNCYRLSTSCVTALKSVQNLLRTDDLCETPAKHFAYKSRFALDHGYLFQVKMMPIQQMTYCRCLRHPAESASFSLETKYEIDADYCAHPRAPSKGIGIIFI